MRFKVGVWIYRVRICQGRLIMEDEPVLAVTLERTIHLSGELAPRDRLHALIDQLRILHQRHYGQMTDEAIVTFTADVMKQLNAQGGEVSLMRLTPDGWVDAGGVEDVGAEPVGCECAGCGTKYTSFQITTATPELDAAIAKMVVRRWVDCEHCGKTMTWTEGATPAGNPNGRVFSGPEFIPLGTHLRAV